MASARIYLTSEGKAAFSATLLELLNPSPAAGEGAPDADALAFLRGRAEQLRLMLDQAVVIEEPRPIDYVRLGSQIVVEDEQGEFETYTMVSAEEANPRTRHISSGSPIGRALIGKRIEDEVTVVAPAGSFRVTIREIH